MAKDIIVTEGSELKILKNVASLATVLPGESGDQVYWVPEDETRLITKTIVEDGTYLASKEIGSPYGYSEVTVSGAGNKVVGVTGIKNVTENGTYYANQDKNGPFYGYSKVIVNVTGKSGSSSSGKKTSGTVGKDSDGDDAMAVVDPTTGELEIEKIPSRIEVVTPPTQFNYYSGQQIDFSGLVVHGYTANDEDLGEIPFDQLIFPVTVADIIAITDNTGIREIDGKLVEVTRRYTVNQDCVSNGEWVLDCSVTTLCPEGAVIIYYEVVVSDTYDLGVYYKWSQDGEYRYHGDDRGVQGFVSTTNELGISSITGKPIYWTWLIGGDRTSDGINWKRHDTPLMGQSPYSKLEAADIALHGTGDIPGNQTIPVQWARSGDESILETSFTIMVSEMLSPSNNDDSFQPA